MKKQIKKRDLRKVKRKREAKRGSLINSVLSPKSVLSKDSVIKEDRTNILVDNNIIFLDTVPEFKTDSSLKIRIITSLLFVLSIVLFFFIAYEIKSSDLQASYFYDWSKKLSFEKRIGEGAVTKSPVGPYDLRLGYSSLEKFDFNLKKSGFKNTSHTTLNKETLDLEKLGITIPYEEKTQSGLKINGYQNQKLYNFIEPNWIYPEVDKISPLIINTLLFIEDKYLLDSSNIKHNPSIEWDRFVRASTELVIQEVFGNREVSGGSTLATQLEKFRHSPDGMTTEPFQKISQMLSASLKAYRFGENSLSQRKKILLNYINSVPLAAVPGFGEVFGLGDGLWSYYGEDPRYVNEILNSNISSKDIVQLRKKAKAYKQVLSLFLAHKRPTEFLIENPLVLENQINKYLPILFESGIIDFDLYSAALSEPIRHRRVLPRAENIKFNIKKGQNVIRTHLLSSLGIDSFYELDRLDLEVNSTLNPTVQDAVSRTLLKLNNSKNINDLGLNGFRMLSTGANPEKVIYSFTLFEHENGVNKLRVQTDTLNQPLNINEGVKLDLGSTAKFRTLALYLEVIEEIHHRYYGKDKKNLEKELTDSKDILSKWVIEKLISTPQINLTEILNNAMDRQYSANPGERFFTGSGVHYFENFNKEDNNKVLSVRDSIRNSVNLPFIRLMRDLVKYFSYHVEGSTARTLDKMDEQVRSEYLQKFADNEGKVFIRRFFDKYKGKSEDQILTILLDSVKSRPSRFASIYWFLNPTADIHDFSEFMKKRIDHAAISEKEIEKYYDWYTKRATSLADRGYLASMHPLELLVAAYVIKNPKSGIGQLFKDTYKERIEVYSWLMKSSKKVAQDKRIQILLEAEAFNEIHKRWARLGYPLPSLVPSYATALGTSADRPDALAELMGIVLNKGIKYPKISIENLKFGENTPYGRSYDYIIEKPNRVLSETVSEVLKLALFDVVSNGTAIRLKDGIKIGKEVLPVGGKTGTGDHRYQVFSKGGSVKESRVVNRTATFMFILGDKYFGVITAFVPGSEASKFKFTSALPVQLLKLIAPDLLLKQE